MNREQSQTTVDCSQERPALASAAVEGKPTVGGNYPADDRVDGRLRVLPGFLPQKSSLCEKAAIGYE